jgi:hypothetical protein
MGSSTRVPRPRAVAQFKKVAMMAARATYKQDPAPPIGFRERPEFDQSVRAFQSGVKGGVT